MANIRLKFKSSPYLEAAETSDGHILYKGKKFAINRMPLDVPINGTVYGTLLNYKSSIDALQDIMHKPPYNKPPSAPILYIKPNNTFTSFGEPVPMPEGCEQLEIGACLGIVIGKTATRVPEATAMEYIEGYTLVNDISIPHKSVYRPAIPFKARDKFCPIGPWIVDRDSLPHPEALTIRVYINGELMQVHSPANLVRPIPKLIADITEFMTLNKGDLLLAGIPENAPLAKIGDRVVIESDEIGCLENKIIAEETYSLEGFL
ncbi:fumarylacetoacetate hydrolase family protein [Bacillus testis]|uniref:fumarylacetoacetate hydrolase family protein n=1 Tax=Bacillus testis TaxID=1622072 RepID=UPI00067F0E11|nr:fumarylacetoacetate hydrolase family protein [Bacillus testis]